MSVNMKLEEFILAQMLRMRGSFQLGSIYKTLANKQNLSQFCVKSSVVKLTVGAFICVTQTPQLHHSRMLHLHRQVRESVHELLF